MNGPIAQLVALACHANARIRRIAPASRFFADNSTCRFCDSIVFVRERRGWLGRARMEQVAPDPDAWFHRLAASGARSVRIAYERSESPTIPDRMSAGFVGGGGRWHLEASDDNGREAWLGDWHVWSQQAADGRIWRVRYRGIDVSATPAPAAPSLPAARQALLDALQRIEAFARAHDTAGFVESFEQARRRLESDAGDAGFHRDLAPPGLLPSAAAAVLDAAQSAWVFGGMGSWNDQSFDGAAGAEYEAASEQLFNTTITAICAATNAAADA